MTTTKFPEVGDRVKSREGFEGKVTGFGSHAGHTTIIVEGAHGETHTYQPEVLMEPEAIDAGQRAATPPGAPARRAAEPPTVVDKPSTTAPKPGTVVPAHAVMVPAHVEEPKGKAR
jgi:hypothetical protein